MNRREAMLRVAGFIGASFSAPLMMGLSNYENADLENREEKLYRLPANQKELIETISELIIPETKTPGAKAAKVPEFIVMMIEECYSKEDRVRFYSGLQTFNESAITIYGKSFTDLSTEEQTNHFLKEEKINKVLYENASRSETPFIIMIKELTLFGYFTSEIGCNQALNYLPVPGAYKSCMPLEEGQKAWAL